MESYMFFFNPSDLKICMETIEGNAYNDGLPTPCIESSSTSWRLPHDAPDVLYYYISDDPEKRGLFNIMDDCPFIRVWLNKTYIPPQSTINLLTNVNQIDLVVKNTGLGDLIFLRTPILRKTSTDDVQVRLSYSQLKTLSQGEELSLSLSFSGSFEGFIVINTNDIQINYFINLYIKMDDNPPPSVISDTTNSMLSTNQLSDSSSKKDSSQPTVLVHNWLLLYIILPTAVFLVVSLSVIGVIFWKHKIHQTAVKEEESTGIQITEEEESSGFDESAEEPYSPDKDKFFLGSTKPV